MLFRSIVAGKYNVGCAAAPNTESCSWWDHLRRAGFVAGAGASQPFNAFTGLLGVQTGDGNTPPGLAANNFTGLMMCSANIPDKVAIAMDTQMDDGSPNTGAVRGQNQTTPNPDLAVWTGGSGYQETGTNTYMLCKSL